MGSSINLRDSNPLAVICVFVLKNPAISLPNWKEIEMAKNILHLGDKGYGSDHLIKAMKDYTCKWCENKFVEPLTPVCRDCAWWLRS